MADDASTTPVKSQSITDKLEPVVILLFVGMVFFTGIMLVCEKFYPNDGQLFQVVAGMLTGFSGAFFMRVKPKGAEPATPTVPTTVASDKSDG